MSLKIPQELTTPYSNKQQLWLDGDVIAYRAAAVSDDSESHMLGVSYAVDTIRGIIDALDSDDVHICFTGKNNFRNDVYPLYKYHRRDVVKPRHLNTIKQALMKRYPSYIEDGFEADDLLARYTTAENTILVTIDKDLMQCGVPFYNFIKKELYNVSANEAMLLLFRQVLTGDRTDNIPGIAGVGPAKAAKIIKDGYCIQQCYVAAFLAYKAVHKDDYDAAEVMAMNYNLITMQYTADVQLLTAEKILELYERYKEIEL